MKRRSARGDRSGRGLGLLLVLLAAVACGSCATTFNKLPQEPGLNPRLTPYSYLEEGNLVSLAVDTEAARRREGSPYIPLAIGLANLGADTLSIDRESFTLVDDQGRRYSLASVQEFRATPMPVAYDARLSRHFWGVFTGRFEIWPRMPALFFPTPSGGLVRDRIEMSRHTWILDQFYFPHPEGELLGRHFELWFDCAELEHPVFVKFAVK